MFWRNTKNCREREMKKLLFYYCNEMCKLNYIRYQNLKRKKINVKQNKQAKKKKKTHKQIIYYSSNHHHPGDIPQTTTLCHH